MTSIKSPASRMKGAPSIAFAVFSARLLIALIGLLLLTFCGVKVQAGSIYIPNASFETPDASANTNYALPDVDDWEKIAQPTNYDNPDFPWYDQSGVFYNVPYPGYYIDNCDGNQAAFLFATPGVAIFQDYTSTYETDNGTNTVGPTYDFDATYNPSSAYTLTVAVLGYTGDGAPLATNATMQLSLYYRDSMSNIVTVAATSVTNTVANFPVHTHFVDFQAQLPAVKPTDPWAGQKIGIELLSTVTDDASEGGYWDLDNVRLVETPTPVLDNFAQTNGQFSFTLLSQPGLHFDIQATTNIMGASVNWTTIGTVTNATGTISFTDTTTNFTQRFYRAHQAP